MMTVILKCFVKQILRIHFKTFKGQSFAVALNCLMESVSTAAVWKKKKRRITVIEAESTEVWFDRRGYRASTLSSLSLKCPVLTCCRAGAIIYVVASVPPLQEGVGQQNLLHTHTRDV